jgi:hypothetical protein
MFDTWRFRSRDTSRAPRCNVVEVQALESRELLTTLQPESGTITPWTGYWQTNHGGLYIDGAVPSHGGLYSFVTMVLNTGDNDVTNRKASYIPNAPSYVFNSDPDKDNPFTNVLSGKQPGSSSASKGGTFSLTMLKNPGFPQTPDKFVGTYTINGVSTILTGTYVGALTDITASNVIAGTDTTPPRPRPEFIGGGGGAPPSRGVKSAAPELKRLAAQIERAIKLAQKAYHKLSLANADALDLVAEANSGTAVKVGRLKAAIKALRSDIAALENSSEPVARLGLNSEKVRDRALAKLELDPTNSVDLAALTAFGAAFSDYQAFIASENDIVSATQQTGERIGALLTKGQ